ncbi:hypothetical protein JHN63_06835 [Streptomyces sp. MBT65]|uniref:hypothetical protein n=1 Tax=Streptomyces sp. MBT65 TaxID=1488395 RepID=UPI00190C3C6E|nr:hypothetical protein [Streptomyces sp. MBT65]MBK3573539.1 hypothetical protein [Streptomyces sp. MBT65]
MADPRRDTTSGHVCNDLRSPARFGARRTARDIDVLGRSFRHGPAPTGHPDRFVDVGQQVTAFDDVLLRGDATTRTGNAATLARS